MSNHEGAVEYVEGLQVVHIPHITLGVSIERHSKGTNWSVRVDGCEDLGQLLAIADKMRNEMEHRFGTSTGA